MVYELMTVSKGDYEFRVLHDRDHYTVWNGRIFVASCDNIKEIREEIEEYYTRITGKKKR